MLQNLEVFFNKKADQCFEFLERVTMQDAPDYRCFVSAEMWLQLIYARITNDFYRTQDQMWFDFDLITHCCETYNGPEHELTFKCTQMVEKIRKELKAHINCNQEKRLQKSKQFEIGNKGKVDNFGFATDSSSTPIQPKFKPNAIGTGGNLIK